jgi:hypothetical protein
LRGDFTLPRNSLHIVPSAETGAGARPAKTSAERQRAYRARQAAAGLVPLTIMIPESAIPEMRMLAEVLCAHPRMAPAMVRDEASGKMRSIRTLIKGSDK